MTSFNINQWVSTVEPSPAGTWTPRSVPCWWIAAFRMFKLVNVYNDGLIWGLFGLSSLPHLLFIGLHRVLPILWISHPHIPPTSTVTLLCRNGVRSTNPLRSSTMAPLIAFTTTRLLACGASWSPSMSLPIELVIMICPHLRFFLIC